MAKPWPVLFLTFAAPLLAAPEVGYGRGQMHPDFRLPTVDGGFGRLSDHRGRKVVLFHFASW
ncbi:MAG: peroxiredoxin family protein [Planctomycetota bacterium]|jgi:hypothetical protein